ncbi:hydroxyphenylacetyl-CoA thioesterase PaaI [Nocardioides sp. GXZ039]|uniref:hydroxyphenylacetyl-CoA thioesterase PaaI n=1 Tax=Nocardioides sp. GXZ039 TaxID=3136018 RepID=UPI0030F42756
MPEPAEPVEETPQQVAERSAQVMLAGDRATAAMGMVLDDVGPGYAVVSMTVRPDMVNGWGAAHGGLMSALGDTAFAVACNSFGEVTVAAGFDVTFLAPVREGDDLVATARLRSRSGRSGVYDVTIARRADAPDREPTPVIEFRGRSRSLGRPIEPGATH